MTKKLLLLLIILSNLLFEKNAGSAFSQPVFRALAFYRTNVEKDHVDFANNAIAYFQQLGSEKNFVFDTTTLWEKHTDSILKKYDLIVWLNEFPHNQDEKEAFQRYMEGGGAWLGFHVSGYNDKDSHWPWIVEFLGGTVFLSNNWPPLAAKLIVDNRQHPVTKDMPATFISPINEWYSWKPSARLNKDVQVLITLDTSNYPLGKKHLLTGGDIPVVWTNTKFHMLYMNMGHGDKVMSDPLQNHLFANAIMWLGDRNKKQPVP